jgi:tetraacyldisaccharide 4'-kinase
MGNLRESKAGASRANIIIVNKCPSRLGRKEMDAIVVNIHPASTQKVFFSALLYSYPYNIQSPQQKLVIDKHTAILAITGVAEPIPFIRHLQKFTEQLYWQRYSDHHKFNKVEIAHLINYYLSIPLEKKYIITTEKDAVRLSEYLSEFGENNIHIYAIPVQMIFLPYKEDFNQFITEYFNYYYPPTSEDDIQATDISSEPE